MSGRARRRLWVVGLLKAVPQVLLLLQGRGQSQLGVFAAVVFLFWSLVACAGLALWSTARPLAGALASGAAAGFVLAVVAAFAA